MSDNSRPEGTTLEGGEVIFQVHAEADCKGPCPIHKLSDHHMRGWPQHWRSDRYLMERTCPHGVGHPDPDDPSEDTVHGCDGCCTPPDEETATVPHPDATPAEGLHGTVRSKGPLPSLCDARLEALQAQESAQADFELALEALTDCPPSGSKAEARGRASGLSESSRVNPFNLRTKERYEWFQGFDFARATKQALWRHLKGSTP